jgi:hypothetical protein
VRKRYKILLVGFLALLVLTGGLGIYSLYIQKKNSDGVPVYQGEKIQGNFVHAVKFTGVEGNRIKVTENGQSKEYPLNDTGLVLNCTRQVIGDEPVVNYGQITEVKPISPGDIGKEVTAGDPVILLEIKTSGGSKVQTIITSKCS